MTPEMQQHPSRAWERSLLVGLIAFSVVSVAGYGIFGLHPELLSRFPGAAEIYGVAFTAFAQGQIWLTYAVLALVLSVRAGRRWLPAFAAVYGLSLLSEGVGTTWGVPFGGYAYTDLLGPKWFDRVPWVIPMSWFMMAVPAWALSRRALPRRGAWAPVLVGGLALVAWDLALDPAMSGLTTYWTWFESGPYYGMPWLNLAGWLLTGVVLMAVFAASRADRWLAAVPSGWLAGFYAANLALPLGMVAVAGEVLAVGVTAAGYAALGGLVWALRRPAAAAVSDGHGGPPPLRREPIPVATGEWSGRARSGLSRAADDLAREGMAAYAPTGQLMRPVVAAAVADHLGAELDEEFWTGALAVQLAHEASLVHDDAIDGAPVRRGGPTVAAAKGVPAAIVRGDHLLTTAYRAAAGAGEGFAGWFARAVERTVAGELAQARLVGRRPEPAEYEAALAGKSGELFGAAAVLPALRVGADGQAWFDLGRELGLLYQLLDDLLDLCPAAATGKEPYLDHAGGKWTWPLAHVAGDALAMDTAALAAALRAPGPAGTAPLAAARDELVARYDRFRDRLVGEVGPGSALVGLVVGWRRQAIAAVAAELGAGEQAGAAAEPAAALFRRRSRSFSFAARLLPAAEREAVTAVYAFCRATDDLADDEAVPVAIRRERLASWRRLAAEAHAGQVTGVASLDRAMGLSARAGVPFADVAALLDGMAMDLDGTHYEDMADLHLYTYRVAGVVGQWLTRLFGIDDPWVLDRAARLGHGMQLTNILRDVGEDWAAGRCYLPRRLRERHGVSTADLDAMAAGGLVTPGYRALAAEVMGVSEAHYAAAWPAMPALPRGFARASAVAAAVYRGIHRDLIAHGFDAFGRRAHTGGMEKLGLAVAGLWRLRRQRQQGAAAGRGAAGWNMAGEMRS